MLPSMLVMIYYAWPLFVKMYLTRRDVEQRRRPDALAGDADACRWALRCCSQGVSEAIKRVAWLAHKYDADFHYERPLQ